MREFDYWKEVATRRMDLFARKYHGTEFQDRTWKDYQLADKNAQAVYLEMSDRELSYIPEEKR